MLIYPNIADVKTYFDIERSPGASASDEGISLASSNILPMDVIFGVSPAYTKQDLINLLPPKADLDRYVSTWFNAPDPLRGEV